MDDYTEKGNNVAAVSALLSAKPDQIENAVEHLLKENSALKQQLASLKNQIFTSRCANIQEGAKNVCLFEPDLEPADLRAFCLLLCSRCSGIAAVFSGDDAAGYQYALASAKDDIRVCGKELNQAFSGKGGGSRELVQGTVFGAKNDIRLFIENHS